MVATAMPVPGSFPEAFPEAFVPVPQKLHVRPSEVQKLSIGAGEDFYEIDSG